MAQLERDYHEVYAASASIPAAFWLDAATAIDWVTPPVLALDESAPPSFVGFSTPN